MVYHDSIAVFYLFWSGGEDALTSRPFILLRLKIRDVLQHYRTESQYLHVKHFVSSELHI